MEKTAPRDDSQKAAVLKAAGLSDAPEKKSPAPTDLNAAPGKVKPEHHANAARPSDAPTPRDAALPADTPAEPKAPAPHQPQPQAQATEHAAPAARTALAERPELPATAAAPAQLNASAPPPPFNLAAHTPAPLAVSPLVALHVDSAADNAVPVAGLAVEIVARVHDGLRRFEIRLDPPELGRIDVRLDVDHSGKVTSRLMVERAETLDLLRRDAPSLERALQHAGLNTEGGLEFSLRDQNFANREQAPRDGASRLIVPDDEAVAAEAARRGYGRVIGLGGGVDIRV
jgi:flagellar hook-length control protein FliK